MTCGNAFLLFRSDNNSSYDSPLKTAPLLRTPVFRTWKGQGSANVDGVIADGSACDWNYYGLQSGGKTYLCKQKQNELGLLIKLQKWPNSNLKGEWDFGEVDPPDKLNPLTILNNGCCVLNRSLLNSFRNLQSNHKANL